MMLLTNRRCMTYVVNTSNSSVINMRYKQTNSVRINLDSRYEMLYIYFCVTASNIFSLFYIVIAYKYISYKTY